MNVARVIVFAAGDDQQKAAPLGLLVLLLLGVACYFLFKSMSRHLKRVREDFPLRANAPPQVTPAPATTSTPGTRSAPPVRPASSDSAPRPAGLASTVRPAGAGPEAGKPGSDGADGVEDGEHLRPH